MADNECDGVCRMVDDVLRCELPAKHTDPTGALPQGSPHESSEYTDSLTGEPWRWWG